MGKIKKIGIGFGIGILSFFVIGISYGMYVVHVNETMIPLKNITQSENSMMVEKDQSTAMQDESQIKLLNEIQEEEKQLQYVEELKQKDASELNFADKTILKDPQKYKEQSEQRLQRLNALKQQGLEYLDTEKEILDYVFSYQGRDNQGNNLQTEMILYFTDKYVDTFSEKNQFAENNKFYVTTADTSDNIEISINDFVNERYRYAIFLIFAPESGFDDIQLGYEKTVFTFLFDTETYRIIGEDELAKSIIETLENN